MLTTVHRLLKIIAFNANGIERQAYQVRKQLQDSKIDVALFSETRLETHMRFYIPNFDIYLTECEGGRKGGNSVASLIHAQTYLLSFL
jgi:exonuclease III